MSNTLKVLVDGPSNPDVVTRAARPSLEDLLGSVAGKAIEMDVHAMGKALSSAYGKVLESLSNLPSREGYNLQSVSFSLVIDATGEISLASTVSGTLKTQAGLTFVITRGTE